ncbi:MAG TPA: c-type cytochrome [Candidatus Aquilonibacter sp.]
MQRTVGRATALIATIALSLGATAAARADVNAGAALVQKNGCQGCHGANFEGTSGFPALYGIEHKRSHDQIVDAIQHPKAPMPNFGFTSGQAGDIADYLASLDGGASQNRPTITITPAHPIDDVEITVHFPGTPPKHVTAVATMSMGSMPMHSPTVVLKQGGDSHLYTGKIEFSMGGPWTIRVKYDGKQLDQPISVGQ